MTSTGATLRHGWAWRTSPRTSNSAHLCRAMKRTHRPPSGGMSSPSASVRVCPSGEGFLCVERTDPVLVMVASLLCAEARQHATLPPHTTTTAAAAAEPQQTCPCHRPPQSRLLLPFLLVRSVVAFRGTSAPQDFLTDVKIAQVPWKGPVDSKRGAKDVPMVHGGFREALESVQRRLKELIIAACGAEVLRKPKLLLIAVCSGCRG